jgi:hypothetical protein
LGFPIWALNDLNVDTRLLLPGYPQAIVRAPGLREIPRLGRVRRDQRRSPEKIERVWS